MKKFLSILMALTLVMSLCAVSFSVSAADETGTITVNNVNKDQVYKAYRIFDLSWDGGSAYSYTVNSEWTDFLLEDDTEKAGLKKLKSGFETYFSYDADTGVITANTNSETVMQEFAQKALKYAEDNPTIVTKSYEPDKDETDPSSYKYTTNPENNVVSITFSGLTLGYYLIDSSLGAMCGLNTSVNNATVNDKNSVPTITKKVEENTNAGSRREDNNADIGDTINYFITIYVGNGAQNYVLVDTMDAGLTLNRTMDDGNADTTFTVSYNDSGSADSKTTVDPTNYTVVYGTAADDFSFKIEFKDAFVYGLAAGSTINVDYTATLNEKATIGENNPNVNKAYLSYGTVNNAAKTNMTDVVPVKTYTYQVGVMKTNDANAMITGAQFKLYEDRDEKNVVKFVKSAPTEAQQNITAVYRRATQSEIADANVTTTDTLEAGNIIIQGLDQSTYYLRETHAPDGFNKLSDLIEVVVENYDSLVESLSAQAAGEETATVTYASGGVQVINYSGALLPGTGGMGTVLFYVLGSVLILGAAIFFIVRLRMRGEKKTADK